MPRSITGFALRLTLLLIAISGGLALLALGITRGVSSSALVFSQFDEGRGQYFVYLDPYRALTVSRYAALHDTEAAGETLYSERIGHFSAWSARPISIPPTRPIPSERPAYK